MKRYQIWIGLALIPLFVWSSMIAAIWYFDGWDQAVSRIRPAGESIFAFLIVIFGTSFVVSGGRRLIHWLTHREYRMRI